MNDQTSSIQFFRQIFGGAWVTQAIFASAELGIADLLASGPLGINELAERTGTNSSALYRLLRALASAGVFAEDLDGRFTLTPLAALLRSDADSSQRAFSIMMGAEFYQTWGELLYSVQSGSPGFNKRYGMPFFQYMLEHSERHALYDEAMNGVHGAETEPMLDAYDFSAFRTVVDVGGGNGQALCTLLNRHPAIQGTLFDLPGVAERARQFILHSPAAPRCEIRKGDFFAAVPAGADAYVLRHVIHDWQDEQAEVILQNCREAMHSQSRILVVEHVIPQGNAPSFGKWLDLMMLLVGGQERSEEEYRRLFSQAGLKLMRVIPTTAEVSILEGMRL